MSELRMFRVLVAVGPDRPGLARGVSASIHHAGANIEDSRMAVLGGEFAIILLYTGTLEAIRRVDGRRADLERQLGLAITIRETNAPDVTRASARYALRVSGIDRPGIVDFVTSALADRDINVQSLHTHLEHQALTGTQVFVLEANVTLPANASPADLNAALERVCEEEQLELVLRRDPSSMSVAGSE